MNTRDIVRKAWQMTQVHLKKLIWYGAVPAFFSVVVSVVYLAYQYEAFRSSPLFSDHPSSGVISNFGKLWGFVSGHVGLSIAFGVMAVLIVLGYILLPPIFRGTLIQAVMRIRHYKPIEGSFQTGVRKFFPMFEFGLLTGAFSITTLFTEGSFVLRWWGERMFFFVLPMLLFVAMVGLIISFLFTYSEYFIVLKDENIMKSLGSSAVLVISNLRRTILIFILMILISARVILNVLLVLFIPMLIIGISSFFATVAWVKVGIAINILIGIGLVLLASYLMGLFHVFSTTVWVLTFDILSQKGQEVIADEDLGGNGE